MAADGHLQPVDATSRGQGDACLGAGAQQPFGGTPAAAATARHGAAAARPGLRGDRVPPAAVLQHTRRQGHRRGQARRRSPLRPVRLFGAHGALRAVLQPGVLLQLRRHVPQAPQATGPLPEAAGHEPLQHVPAPAAAQGRAQRRPRAAPATQQATRQSHQLAAAAPAPSPPPPPQLGSAPPEHARQPTADRLGALQQRYRQHQAAMRATTPNIPLTVVEMSANDDRDRDRGRASRSSSFQAPAHTFKEPQLPPSRDSGYPEWEPDQPWGRHRSSSVSGSDASPRGLAGHGHGPSQLRDVSGFATTARSPRRASSGLHSPPAPPTPPDPRRANGFFGRSLVSSSSVSDLQGMTSPLPHQHPPAFHTMHQAQSMAQLNCPSCHGHGVMWMPPPQQHMMPPWADPSVGGFQHGRTASNQSLQQAFDSGGGGFAPWPGAWHPGPYPATMQMQPPPPPSPALSARRRPASPAASQKSRRSLAGSLPRSQQRPRQRRPPPTPSPSPSSSSGSLTDSDEERQRQQQQRDRRERSRHPPRDEDDRRAESAGEEEDASEEEDECPRASASPSPPPAPKPVVPRHEWACEHCTFVNRAGTRVCAVCCRTPSDMSHTPPPPPQRRTPAPDRQRSRAAPAASTPASAKRHLRPSDRSDSDDTAAVAAKFGKHLRISASSSSPQTKKQATGGDSRDTRRASQAEAGKEKDRDKKKGMTTRKISFWPGTKFYR